MQKTSSLQIKEQSLTQAILAAMETYLDRVCLKVKRGKRYQSISYHRLQTLSFRLVQFLWNQGISNEDRIAIVADNSLEWMVTYIACVLSGATVLPLTASLSPDMLHFILRDSQAKMIIAQNKDHIQAVLDKQTTENNGQLPNLNTILVINNSHPPSPDIISFATALDETIVSLTDIKQTIIAQANQLEPTSLASIQYVTRESRLPGGAVFNHRQNLMAVQQISTWFNLEADDLGFSLQPWSELPSLLISLHYFLAGVANVVGQSYKTLADDMQATSPTIMYATPHAFEHFYDTCMARIDERPELTREAFQWAMAKSRAYRTAGTTASPELQREYTRAYMTFFSQFRGAFGGRLRRFYSAGGALPKQLGEFFLAIGLPIQNVYSLTEAGGFPAASQLRAYQAESCGQPVSGFQIRIAADGEVLVKGETVMKTYWGQSEKNGTVFDSEGWLCSGDMGYLDDDGYLYITGRKPNAVLLSIGYKVASGAIETMLLVDSFIKQAAVFGNGKSYISALIVPDLMAISQYIEKNNLDVELNSLTIDHPVLKQLIEQTITTVNKQLDQWEQIKQYKLLENPLPENPLLSKTYVEYVESMYPTNTYISGKEITQVQISPHRLHELLEKESILDAWLADAGIQFLFDLARDKHIDVPSMVHICDTVAAIAQMESEEKPLSTAIIVGDPIRIGRVLPHSQVQLLRHDHVRRMRKALVTLAKMVDGLVLGYVVDKHGYVRGIHKLKLDRSLDTPANFLLGPHFSRHAAISQQCDAVVFFVPAGGRQARVFANGQLIGRYANGDWSPDDLSHVDDVINQLAARKNYDLALIRRMLRCSFQMAEENLGAIFVIGNADNILKHSDAPEISSFTMMISTDVNRLSDRELINFAKQDGATVIDVQGEFRGCMVLLRPGANTQAEIGPGKGARHSSAAKMTAEACCLAITVSQDGPITIYDCGQQILSL